MLLTNLNQKMSGFRGDMLRNNTVEVLAFAGCLLDIIQIKTESVVFCQNNFY